MKKNSLILGTLAGVFMTAMTLAGPVMADDRQKTKNDWRNLAIGAGVIAGHGLINHNSTETILGAAGAAYSANRYEQDRRSQSRASAARARYHRSTTYRTGSRKYYTYNGHRYYMNLRTGHRVQLS